MVVSYTDDFEVTWADPAQARESWVLDRLHAPWAQPPLTQALFERIMAVAFGVPAVFVNGYGFMRDYGPPPTTPEVESRGPVAIWQEEFEPRVRRACQAMRGRDYEALSTAQLVERLPRYFDETAEAFRYTTIVILAFMRPTSALISFLEAELGNEGGLLAARLLQGFENETTAAGLGLARLTDLAAASPQLAAALKEGRFEAIAGLEGGPEFLRRLGEYVSEFGWRADSWYMVHLPTWAENPALAMRMIGRYLDDPEREAMARLQRSSEARRAAITEVEARLTPDRLPRFQTLLEASRAHVAISESRASWQLQICGSVRVPIMALGRRLAATGAIAEPDDVFYLTLEGIRAAAGQASKSCHQTVTAARAELRRCGRLVPPSYLGTAPSLSKTPPDLQAVLRHLRGYGVTPSQSARRINGVGASKGVATGRARILFGLAESPRLEPGDILVCRTTAPPWTPLFAIAAAIVTDAGGLLSHTAICAREFGIPAVVATQVATSQIRDGALITVDGEEGTVLIEA